MMADPFDFSQIDASDPFAGTARQGSIMGLFRPTIEARAAGSTAAFAQRVLEKLGQGQFNFEAVLLQELQTPEGAAALSQPGFLEAMEQLSQAIQKPAGDFGTVGNSVFNKQTGEIGDQAPSEPTAAERLTDAIIAAKADPEKQKLLISQLPRQPNGRLNVTDYIKVIAGGATVDAKQSPLGVQMNQQQAAAALALGRATGDRAPNTIDLVLRGLGQKTNTSLDSIPPPVAQGAAIIQEQLSSAKSQNTLDVLIQSNPALKGKIPQRPSVEDLFKRFREGGGEAAAQGTGAPLTPPIAGGTGGQAVGPTLQIDPAAAQQFEALPVENFAELSPESLEAIVIAVDNGQINLSEEQLRALFAALQALSGGTGGADGRAQ